MENKEILFLEKLTLKVMKEEIKQNNHQKLMRFHIITNRKEFKVLLISEKREKKIKSKENSKIKYESSNQQDLFNQFSLSLNNENQITDYHIGISTKFIKIQQKILEKNIQILNKKYKQKNSSKINKQTNTSNRDTSQSNIRKSIHNKTHQEKKNRITIKIIQKIQAKTYKKYKQVRIKSKALSSFYNKVRWGISNIQKNTQNIINPLQINRQTYSEQQKQESYQNNMSNKTNSKVIHAQKILVGTSNKFSAGYLIIRGSTIEKFIPEAVGLIGLTEEQKKDIIEVPAHQYVLPGIIDTNVSLHNESYDKEWVDNKYLSLLAIKYGITTIINQSFLKVNQNNQNTNEFAPQGDDVNIRVSYKESNFQSENMVSKRKEEIKEMQVDEKSQQNLQVITQKVQQQSHIFSDENEQKGESQEEIHQRSAKSIQQQKHNLGEQVQGDSLADILSEEKEKNGFGNGAEPSTTTRTPSCVLENQTKLHIKVKNNIDSDLELYCDCQNMNIPEQKDLYQFQKSKLTLNKNIQEVSKFSNKQTFQKQSEKSDDNRSESSLNSNNQQEYSNLSQQEYPKIIQSSNKYKLFTSPPVDPNVPFFTKPEQIAGFIKNIIDKQNKISQDIKNDSFESSYSEEDECIENEKPNQSSFKENRNNQIPGKIEFSLEFQQTANSQQPTFDSEGNIDNNIDQDQQFIKLTHKMSTDKSKILSQNQIQLSVIPETSSQQTICNSITNQDITESSESKSSNLQNSNESHGNQSLKKNASSQNSQIPDQQSLIIQEEDDEQYSAGSKKKDIFFQYSYQVSNPVSQNIVSTNWEEEKQETTLSKNKIEESQNSICKSSFSPKKVQSIEKGSADGQINDDEDIKNINQSISKQLIEQSIEKNFHEQSNKNGSQLSIKNADDFTKNEMKSQIEETQKTDLQNQDDRYEEISSPDNIIQIKDIYRPKSIYSKRKKQGSKKNDNKNVQIFFIHPSSQQGDNNLALSSPFRQQQFSERIILQKQPPKIGGDALRAPFEKDYEETMLDLKQIDPNQEDYNEEVRQFLQDIFEASKENSKAYTDHLISHSQLSDYNSDFMDDNDKNEGFEFKIDKQSLQWQQPSYQLQFDKERNYFNQECNNYLHDKNIFQQQQEPEIDKLGITDSQYLVNDEVRESQLNLPLQYQSVIQLDEGENDKQQGGMESTYTSIKDSVFSKTQIQPLKQNTYRSSQEFLPDILDKIEKRISIVQNLTINLKNENNVDQGDEKESPKQKQTQSSINEKDSKSEIKQDLISIENIKIETILKLQQDEAQPEQIGQTSENLDDKAKSSEQELTNKQQENHINDLVQKESPFKKQNLKLQNISTEERFKLLFNEKNDIQTPIREMNANPELLTPLNEKEINNKLQVLDGFGVRHVNSQCQSEEEDEYDSQMQQVESKNKSQNKLKIESQSKYIQKIVSELSIEKKYDNDYQAEENKNDYDSYANKPSFMQLRLQARYSSNPEKTDEQLLSPQILQTQESCTSQVKRRIQIQKLDMSANTNGQSQLQIRRAQYSNSFLDCNSSENFKSNLNITQTALSIPSKQNENLQIRSSMSLMERRQKSLMQSINLDTSKSLTKPTQVANNPKADYLHFLSARPFFWEYYALQMYCQVFRQLILQLGRGFLGQTSRSLTSSPITNALHIGSIYQYKNIHDNFDSTDSYESRDRTQSNVLPIANPALINTSAWRDRVANSAQKTKSNSIRNRNKNKKNNFIGKFIFQNISNGLSIVRIFSMRKNFETFSDIYTEVSWPFLFFDSTQIATGDSRFKTEPAIQNNQNKQILQSCLFKRSYHFTVPPKYKFFSQNTQNATISDIANQMNNQHEFPGDFQRAINGLFSLGGQISALWTIAMAQTQPIKPICIRTPMNRSKSSSFSHAYGAHQSRNQFALPTIISTPSIFKLQKQDTLKLQENLEDKQTQWQQIQNAYQQDQEEGDTQLQKKSEKEISKQDDSNNDSKNDLEKESPSENEEEQQNLENPQTFLKIDSPVKYAERGEDSATKQVNSCIENIIAQNQIDNLTNSENHSPQSDFKYKLNNNENSQEDKSNSEEKQNQNIQLDIPNSDDSGQSNSQNTSPKVPLNEQEEKHLIRICDVLSRNPAKICELKEKGTLDEGKNADIIIFDPIDVYEFSALIDEKQKFPAELHILNSQKVQGKVVSTFLRGQKIYGEDKFYLDDFIPIDQF